MKALIRNVIHDKTMAYQVMKRIYHYRHWHPKNWMSDILVDYANYKQNVNFIQVGSNNGITADPISRFITGKDWKGILIEPVPYLFDELVKNYNPYRHRLTFENSAIADTNGKLKFYRLKKSDNKDLPYWYEQLGSFNKEVVVKHKESIPNFDELFIEDSVNAITFTDLIKKHSVKKIDFIQIDTEGYDYEILKMIPYADLDLEFLMFENRHLSDADYRNAIKLLKKNGFVVGSYFKDTIAIKKEVLGFINLSKEEIKSAYYENKTRLAS